MKSITIIMENHETFHIPSKYIKKLNIRQGYVKYLWIDTAYLDICDTCLSSTWYREKQEIIDRFINSTDIVSIKIGNKEYNVYYLEKIFVSIYDDNVLCDIKTNSKLIKFEWNINHRNRYNDNNETLYIQRKYKNKVYDYPNLKII